MKKLLIFHSYDSLPEGIPRKNRFDPDHAGKPNWIWVCFPNLFDTPIADWKLVTAIFGVMEPGNSLEDE